MHVYEYMCENEKFILKVFYIDGSAIALFRACLSWKKKSKSVHTCISLTSCIHSFTSQMIYSLRHCIQVYIWMGLSLYIEHIVSWIFSKKNKLDFNYFTLHLANTMKSSRVQFIKNKILQQFHKKFVSIKWHYDIMRKICEII